MGSIASHPLDLEVASAPARSSVSKAVNGVTADRLPAATPRRGNPPRRGRNSGAGVAAAASTKGSPPGKVSRDDHRDL